MKKRIICYGDSNTWGADPESDKRLPEIARWTSLLQNILGENYTVIEEGLNGRTTVWDDPIEGERNGRRYLTPCINSHTPFDLIIIMLGTNDLKTRFSVSSYDIARAGGVLAKDVLYNIYDGGYPTPKVLLVSPIETGKNIAVSQFAGMFDESAYTRSKEFHKHFEAEAKLLGVEYLNAADYAKPGRDELHISVEEHKKLAEALAKKITEIL